MKTLTILLVVMSLTCTAFASDAKWPEWERIGHRTYRTKLSHGWIVKTSSLNGEALCYVPDENHEWRVDQ